MNTILSTSKSLVSHLLLMLLVLLSGLIFFPYSDFCKFVFFFAGFLFVSDWILNCRWKTWKWSREKSIFAIAVLLGFLPFLWHLFGIDNGSDWMSYWEIMLPFLFFGVAGIANNRTYKLEWFALVMLSVITVQSIIILLQIDWNSFWSHFSTNKHVFNSCRISRGYSHMAFNLYGNMAIVLGFASIRKPLCKVLRTVILLEMIFMCCVIFLTEGRAGFFALMIVIGSMLIYWIKTRFGNKWAIAAGVLTIAVAVIFCCRIVSVRKQEMSEHEPRYYINKVNWKLYKERPLLGYGASGGHNRFVQAAIDDQGVFTHYIEPDIYNNPKFGTENVDVIHPHNAFMELGIAYGVLGWLSLALLLICACVLSYSSIRLEVILIVIIFFIQALFEKIGNDLSPLLLMLVFFVIFSFSPRKTDLLI